MEYASTLDDDVGVLQQVLRVNGAEVALAAPEHHGDDIHRDLVDQPERHGLPTDIAGRDGHVALAGEFFRERDCATYVIDELAGCRWMPAFRSRPVRHDDDVFTSRRSAFPSVGQVEEVPTHDRR